MALPGPFPLPLRELLVDSPALRLALSGAQAAVAATSPSTNTHALPISLVEVIDNQTFNYAGSANHDEMFYSASLLKVAAMVGAHGLEQWVNDVGAATPFAVSSRLFSDLATAFNDVIAGAVPQLRDAPGVPASWLVPSYGTIFNSPRPRGFGPFATCEVGFTDVFRGAVREMIVNSDPDQAAFTIRALGYGYTMGLLSNLGFFDIGTSNGVWLGGSYAMGNPAARVGTVNDGPSAQAATTRQMARLFAQLLQASDLDATSISGTVICHDMLALLEQAQTPHGSIFSAGGTADLGPTFRPLQTKIGIGGLGSTGTGRTIRSEATVIRHLPTGRRFIVVFHNVIDTPQFKRPLGSMVKQAIESYLFATIGYVPV